MNKIEKLQKAHERFLTEIENVNKSILKSIVCNTMIVKYRKRYEWPYIATPYEQIKDIGLLCVFNSDNGWQLELRLNFGDTQEQAKSFYVSNPDISKLRVLERKGWILKNNFHVAHIQSHLVWFDSGTGYDKYIKYWIKNRALISQCKRGEVKALLNELHKRNIIIYDDNIKKKMKNEFYNTEWKTLNVCPGFTMSFIISPDDAVNKTAAGELGIFISRKIKEGLSIVKLNGKEILK